MKKILVMCPSRSAEGKRIPNLLNLYNSWKETTSGNSDFLLGIDENDKHHYPELEGTLLEIIPEQMNVVKKINYLSKRYVDKYDYIHFMGDDCVFTAPKWEDIYLEHAEGKEYAVFYPDDTIQGEKLPTHPFMSTNIIKKLGFMGPECLNHMFVDNFWKEVGNHLECLKYFPEIVLEHRHPAKGYKRDEVYRKNNSYYLQDRRKYNEYINKQFIDDMKVFNMPTKESK